MKHDSPEIHSHHSAKQFSKDLVYITHSLHLAMLKHLKKPNKKCKNGDLLCNKEEVRNYGKDIAYSPSVITILKFCH